VICSGRDDVCSSANPVNALQAMFDTKVVCDSVIIAHSDSCKTLMALSYITGGLLFRPNAAGEGLQLLE
jgi:hypothetical protein